MKFTSLFLFFLLSPAVVFAQADAGVVDAIAGDATRTVSISGPDAVVVQDAGVADAAVQDAAVAEPLPEPPTNIESIEDAAESLDFLVAAARNGSWPLFAGVLVLLLIFLLDRLVAIKTRVPKKAVPWLAAALGVASSVAAALVSGDLPLAQALLQGFLGGATSVGLWEMFFQKWKSRPTV